MSQEAPYDNDRRETPDLTPELEAEAILIERQFEDEWAIDPEADDREMQAVSAVVPEGAISIPDPSAAPSGAQVVQGPRGGWYYVPGPGTPTEPEAGTDEPPAESEQGIFPEPDEDVPRFRNDAALVERVTEFNDRDEWGFTLNADLTNYEGGGLIVTLTSEAFTKADEVGADEVVAFYERWLDVMRAAPERVKLGGWSSEEGVDYKSLDLNVVLPSEQRALAVELGRAFNQQAVFDADNFVPIETGGTGEPVAESPEEVARILEEVLAESELRMRLQDQETSPMDVAGPLFGDHAEHNMTFYESEAGETVSARTIYLRVRSRKWELLDTAEGGRIAVKDTETGDEMLLTQIDTVTDAGVSGGPSELAGEVFGEADAWTDEERAFHAIFSGCVWSEETETRMLNFTPGQMPDAVRRRLLTAIDRGAVFRHFETVDQADRAAVRRALREAVATGEGWTLREMAERIQDVGDVDFLDAERIARTEMAAITNYARALYYEDEFPEAEFRWTGPQDRRTTDACEWLKAQTREGVSIERLLELEREASDRFFPDLEFREGDHVIHPYERHTFVRHYDT